MKNTHSLQKKRKPEFPKNTELYQRKKNNPKNPYHYFFSSSQSKKKRTVDETHKETYCSKCGLVLQGAQRYSGGKKINYPFGHI